MRALCLRMQSAGFAERLACFGNCLPLALEKVQIDRARAKPCSVDARGTYRHIAQVEGNATIEGAHQICLCTGRPLILRSELRIGQQARSKRLRLGMPRSRLVTRTSGLSATADIATSVRSSQSDGSKRCVASASAGIEAAET